MRARNLKPNFFKNEKLAEIPFETRLLFVGLWCMADREGRLEDRPKRIKAELFPYDSVNVEKMLDVITLHGFILRYEQDKERYIQIINFTKHQNPHPHEARSTIPPMSLQAVKCHLPAGLIPDVLIPSSLNPDVRNPESGGAAAPSLSGAIPYQKPDREKDLPRFLVYAYKVAKGFEKEDRGWDKANWARFARPAKEIADLFKDWEPAIACLEDLGKQFDFAGLDWTLETIAKHSHEWKLKREKGEIRHGSTDSKRVPDADAWGQKPNSSPRKGGLTSTGKVFAGGRTVSTFLPETIPDRSPQGNPDGTDA